MAASWGPLLKWLAWDLHKIVPTSKERKILELKGGAGALDVCNGLHVLLVEGNWRRRKDKMRSSYLTGRWMQNSGSTLKRQGVCVVYDDGQRLEAPVASWATTIRHFKIDDALGIGNGKHSRGVQKWN